MSLRWRFLLVVWGIGLLFSAVFTYNHYDSQRNAYMAGVDAKLLVGAQMARQFVGTDFHDRLVDQGSIDEDAYRVIVARNNATAIESGFQYLWSNLVLPDGRVVFTSATSPSKDVQRGDHASFFSTHSDPAAFSEVLRTESPNFTTFKNEWGQGRMVLLPYRDANGRLYVFGASLDLKPIEYVLAGKASLSIGLFALLFLIASLVAHVVSRSMVKPLELLQRTADSIANGDYSTAAPVGGGKEIQALSASVFKMRDAIGASLAELKASKTELN